METRTIHLPKDVGENLPFCHEEDANEHRDGNNSVLADGKKSDYGDMGCSVEKERRVDVTDEDKCDDEMEWEDGNNEFSVLTNYCDPEANDLSHRKSSDNNILTSSKIMENVRSETNENSKGGEQRDDDDDDDDNLDWEDGDGEDEKEVIDISTDEKPADSGRDGDSNDGRNGLKQRAEKKSSTKAMNGTSEKPLIGSRSERKEGIASNTTNEFSKYFDNVTTPSMTTEAIDLDDDDEEEINWEAGATKDSLTSIGADDWGTTKIKSPNEVAAALEHAQGTAANLTNWAGRAFRRAIAQHALENGVEVPESAKPTVLKTKANEINEDYSVPVRGKSTVQSTPGISQSKTEHQMSTNSSNDMIDNSAWLNSVDTSAQAEDFTVKPREAVQSDQTMDPSNTGITEEMRAEVMQLLRLFGIPYVVAPAEAEAQCVELEKLGLVDGIVTEDSDTFVFGGQVVYKNIFEDKKYVEVYHAKDASEEMNLNQDSLVALAMLLGGDYTEGVKGVGIVNGMEILQAFDVADDCEAGLTRFRKWLDGFDPLDLAKLRKSVEDTTGFSTDREKLFHRKHHTARTRWVAPKHFPDVKVLNAYLNPVVDTSRERFSWGIPDLDGLTTFCHDHMGWTDDETKKLILPIIQRMKEGSMRQTRIDSFMRYEDGIKFAKIQSKRLRTVLGLSPLETGDRQPSRRKKADTTLQASFDEHKEDESDSLNESEEDFSSVDIVRNIDRMQDTAELQENDVTRCEWKTKVNDTTLQPKQYNEKKNRSLAALSTASASTTAIAVSSTNSAPNNASMDDTNMPITHHRRVHTNLPKTAPPAYQKHSNTFLEEENSNTTNSQDCDKQGSSESYKVINPSMI